MKGAPDPSLYCDAMMVRSCMKCRLGGNWPAIRSANQDTFTMVFENGKPHFSSNPSTFLHFCRYKICALAHQSGAGAYIGSAIAPREQGSPVALSQFRRCGAKGCRWTGSYVEI